jgi:hypothetical protein
MLSSSLIKTPNEKENVIIQPRWSHQMKSRMLSSSQMRAPNDKGNVFSSSRLYHQIKVVCYHPAIGDKENVFSSSRLYQIKEECFHTARRWIIEIQESQWIRSHFWTGSILQSMGISGISRKGAHSINNNVVQWPQDFPQAKFREKFENILLCICELCQWNSKCTAKDIVRK